MSRGLAGSSKVEDDFLKKTMLSFFGAWLLVHERADDAIRAAIARSRGKAETERDFAEQLTVEVDTEKEVIKDKIEGAVRGGSSGSAQAEGENIISRIEERLARMEERIKRLEKGNSDR